MDVGDVVDGVVGVAGVFWTIAVDVVSYLTECL